MRLPIFVTVTSIPERANSPAGCVCAFFSLQCGTQFSFGVCANKHFDFRVDSRLRNIILQQEFNSSQRGRKSTADDSLVRTPENQDDGYLIEAARAILIPFPRRAQHAWPQKE